MVILLDGSTLSNTHRSLPEQLYLGDIGFRDLDIDEIQENINLLSRIREINGLTSIIEVQREVQEAVKIFNQQINFTKNGTGRIKSRKNRRRVERHNGSFNISHEECPSLTKIREYVDSLYKTIRRVDNFIDPETYFTGQDLDIYHNSLILADNTKDFRSNYVKHNKNPKPKLGDTLDTDNKLMATAITLSFYSPVTFLTRDIRLGLKLRDIQSNIEGRRNNIFTIDANVFFHLEDSNLELV